MVRTAAALALVLFVFADTGAETTTPTEALQQVFAQANDILTDPESVDRPLERLLAVRKLVNDAFDFKSAAELAQTAMARRNGGELSLDYHLIDRDGAWRIRDVAIDGVSLMANYRAQLDRVLGNASFPELLSQMRAKVGVVDQPEPPAPASLVTVDVSLGVDT